MKNTIIVQKRVYGPGPIPGINILVAVPGDEIDVELARSLGLLDEPKTEAKKAPAKKVAKKASVNVSVEPTTNATPYASYPTKKSSGK